MINHILEVVNNLRTINQFAVMIYLGQFLLLGMGPASHPQTIILPDLRRMAMCLGVALETWVGGAVMIGLTIWVNRAMGLGGGTGPTAWWTVPPMSVGSVLMAIGAIMVLRILSIARHGNILWHALIVVDVLYLLFAMV